MVKLNDLQKHELVDWSDEVEDILRTLSEKAQIWRLLHMKNHDIFKRKYYCLVVPVTILSSITGAANLALGSIASGNETAINLVIGALGIIISVISTLNNIFSFQKRKDEHYRAAKDWYRVQRMIDIELSLHKSKRNNVSVFFHLVLQEIERIHEFHPNIRDDVVKKFMKSYKNKKLTIDIPEILTIRKTLIFKDINDNQNIIKPIVPNHNNIHNNIHNNTNRKSSLGRQGTFINMNDDGDKNERNDSSEHSILNTDTRDNHREYINLTPEITEKKNHSFLYNISENINTIDTIDKDNMYNNINNINEEYTFNIHEDINENKNDNKV